MEVKYGWRTYQPSSARVRHILKADGQAICNNVANIALTEEMVDAAPRAFAKNQTAKLKALPVCGACLRRKNRLDNPRRSYKANRLYIEGLEAKVAELEAENLKLKLKIPSEQRPAILELIKQAEQ